MNKNTAPKDIFEAKNPDLRAALAAMQRAAELARRTAIQTDTAIVVVRDGQRMRITAEQLRQESAEHLSNP
ncbi:hypothetical protein [Azomonas macrocytogenes]|uniref:Uncharacterized protein n=1 Tax=Azomonas macrocytogenes TaxID=69962 RepID=A0A839T0M3_AZOMA|nr:hypothetical protein [Azomonas macrocytogenes]MBB3102678.1 hypothetical protein [Azomonas macrocytogenes]